MMLIISVCLSSSHKINENLKTVNYYCSCKFKRMNEALSQEMRGDKRMSITISQELKILDTTDLETLKRYAMSCCGTFSLSLIKTMASS